ncbi:hypothetical protein [Salinicoccus sp. HZC-1]|uniref:hypothetical protein n=1 Tax=Salinicoccus sp. HZC-1 TaxID=3385497 RepID=UPI00398B6D75
MTKFTGEETMYFVTRVNTNSDEETLVRHNTFNGTFGPVNDFGQAKEFSTREEAQQIADLQNTLAGFMGDHYEYSVLRRGTQTDKLDAEGNVVEELPAAGATEEPTQ